MTREEYFENADLITINAQKINILEDMYNTTIKQPFLRKLISAAGDKDVFLDNGWRALSFSEIESCDKDIDSTFIRKGVLPLIDIMNNKYIAYLIKSKNYAIYNCNTNSASNSTMDIRDYIKKKNNKLSNMLRESFGFR